MGFKLDQSGTYKWPVTVEVPVVDGRHDKQKFDGEFKRITQSRIKELIELVASGDLSDVDVVKEVLVGWDGIEDDQGNELKFSQSKLKQLLEVPMAATAIGTAFFESYTGAKRKN